jgi:uncharacterized protein (DUF58 family)
VLPVLTLRLGALTAASGVLALLSPWPWLTIAVCNAALAVAAGVDWWRAPRIDRVEVERDAPAVVTLGQTGTVTWTVHNPVRRPLRVALSDELGPSLGARTRRTAMVVPAGGRARRRVEVRPTRRGRFTLRTITVRATGPWGLAARQRTRPLPHVLTVFPPFHSRAETELRLNRARQLQLGIRASRARGESMEFDSLREYTVDDELRRIDWAATARSAHAVVRTYRAERNQNVLVLVDCARTMAALVGAATAGVGPTVAGVGGTGSIPRLEHAMDAAQAITRLATGLGDRVGMVAFADRVMATVPPRTQRDQLRRLTAAFATIDARLVEADYRAAFAHTLLNFPRRALLIVLTELASEAATETLVPALPMLRRRHLVMVGAVRDPVVETWSRQRPTTAEETYRRAAALRTLDQRTAVARALRQQGATVIDTLPGRLAAFVSDFYLETKAAGRL